MRLAVSAAMQLSVLFRVRLVGERVCLQNRGRLGESLQSPCARNPTYFHIPSGCWFSTVTRTTVGVVAMMNAASHGRS